MNLLHRSKEEPEINLTSLIDVVLLLLVFFMVSTSFVRESEISIQLPEADAPSAERTDIEVLEIAITRGDEFLINGNKLNTSNARNLRLGIERVIGDRRELRVVIRADAQSTAQGMATVMGVAGELGFVDLDFATVTATE